MKLSRHTILAAVMLATGLAFSICGSTQAQRATYQTVSGHGYGHGCPCPTDCPPADGEITEDATEEGTDDGMGEDLPEVADLTSDAGFASADQSAAPNSIGDANYPGYNIFLGGAFYQLDPSGGRRYKVAHNDSAVPQCRAFFNYNYYNNAQIAVTGAGPQQIDVHQYEVGGEYAFWCNSASIQVRVPFVDTFASDITAVPVPTETQFGNVQVALKAVVYRDCCSIYSVGTGLDLPTADDVNFGNGAFVIENEAILLSPYLAGLKYLDECTYVHSFAQVSFPLEGNAVNAGAVNLGEIDLPTLLYLDLSVGRWLTQDCCGNGVVAIAELHYTDALDQDAVGVPGAGVINGSYQLLNATAGATVVHDCWSITPALVLPILDGTDRAFDYEIALYVNRRF